MPTRSDLERVSVYDASQGGKGGGALGFVLKSGSKDIHLDLYWRHRNDTLNANEWFRNANGLSNRARLLHNVFGGTASCPVQKVGDQDQCAWHGPGRAVFAVG
jgi:hypothetical protein